MSASFILNLLILLVTLIAPFFVAYAIQLARRKEFVLHLKVQKITFFICIISVLVLEAQIRVMGGSGSLSSQSPYYDTTFYSTILLVHIIGAVITYILWSILLIFSNKKYKKGQIPGKYTKIHKTLGIITFGGLIYTALTALIVFVLTFVL